MVYPSTYSGHLAPKINILYLNLVKVAGYQSQYVRPNVTQLNGEVLDNLTNAIYNFDGKAPVNLLARTASNFMLPSATVEVNHNRNVGVSIPNGWNDNRFVFYMLVETIKDNISIHELVTGYTDRLDSVQIGVNEERIAPDTLFYINSITKVSEKSLGMHGTSIPVITNSYSVMGGGLSTSAYDHLTTYKMTPINLMQSSFKNQIDGLSDVSTAPVQVAGYQNISDYPSLTQRRYNSPVTMVSELLGNYASRTLAGLTENTMYNHNSVFNEAKGMVADPSLHNASTLSYLSSHFYKQTTTFEYKFLMDLDPYLESKVNITRMIHSTGMDSSYWDAATLEAVNAVVVSNMVTAWMNQYSLTQLSFSMSNRLATGFGVYNNPNQSNDHVDIFNIIGLSEQSNHLLVNSIGAIQDTIAAELGPIISKNGEIDYTISVEAKLNTDIVVNISFGTNPMEQFIFPSFADALVSPMVTTRSDIYQNNTRDIGTAMNLVENHLMKKTGNMESLPSIFSDVRSDTLTGNGVEFHGQNKY